MPRFDVRKHSPLFVMYQIGTMQSNVNNITMSPSYKYFIQYVVSVYTMETQTVQCRQTLLHIYVCKVSGTFTDMISFFSSFCFDLIHIGYSTTCLSPLPFLFTMQQVRDWERETDGEIERGVGRGKGKNEMECWERKNVREKEREVCTFAQSKSIQFDKNWSSLTWSSQLEIQNPAAHRAHWWQDSIRDLRESLANAVWTMTSQSSMAATFVSLGNIESSRGSNVVPSSTVGPTLHIKGLWFQQEQKHH